MGTEVFERDADEFSVVFGDTLHDGISTEFGIVQHLRRITIGKGEDRFAEGSLYVHLEGDVSKISISELSYNSTFVTAIAFADLSAGLERSGCDPQSGSGEIVLVVLMDSDMPDHTMARAAITATEGITASVQDLGLAFNGNPASGSVSQKIIAVRSRECGLYLRGAGKHTKLGELIGRSTIEAVKSSAASNGTTIDARRSIIQMLGDYGYDQDRLFKMADMLDYARFLDKVLAKDADSRAVATVSAVIHIHNEVQWGLLDEGTGLEAAMGLMRVGLHEPVRSSSILDSLAQTAVLFFKED